VITVPPIEGAFRGEIEEMTHWSFRGFKFRDQEFRVQGPAMRDEGFRVWGIRD
jgi:hypothetical protein